MTVTSCNDPAAAFPVSKTNWSGSVQLSCFSPYSFKFILTFSQSSPDVYLGSLMTFGCGQNNHR
jgi:hypothetical protein